jgi:3-hydroxybutyryl-CoA dehydrogenase
MVIASKVAIIGAGLMGAGLVRLFSAAGWTVSVSDPDSGSRERIAAAVAGISVYGEPAAAVQDARLVIEAAPEIPALKQALFAELAALTGEGTLLATNSSVIPVGIVSEKVSDPNAGRVLGLHFWNPPDVIPLVEVIQGARTAQESIAAAIEIMRAVGKEPVHVRRDAVPGNRMQHALWREAIALVEEGICTSEDIDLIVKRSFGLRLPVLGPLENADLIGLDLTRQIHTVVMPTLSRETAPPPALTGRVDEGRLGIKTGSGFYERWSPEKIQALRQRLSDHLSALLGTGRQS